VGGDCPDHVAPTETGGRAGQALGPEELVSRGIHEARSVPLRVPIEHARECSLIEPDCLGASPDRAPEVAQRSELVFRLAAAEYGRLVAENA
jgi:hypothetical protein